MSAIDEDLRRLRLLRAEIEADKGALDTHHGTVDAALGGPPWAERGPELAVVAVAIQHYYGAAESVFERIARVFEGLPERGDRWRTVLLGTMALAIDDVRPAVIRPETLVDLRELLGFRHFFRHAYAVTFDPERLRRSAQVLSRNHPRLVSDLSGFVAAVERACSASASAPTGDTSDEPPG